MSHLFKQFMKCSNANWGKIKIKHELPALAEFAAERERFRAKKMSQSNSPTHIYRTLHLIINIDMSNTNFRQDLRWNWEEKKKTWNLLQWGSETAEKGK